MGKSRERLVLVPDNRYADSFAEVYARAERAPDSLRAGVEAIVAIAEQNPRDVREGLWRLQGDWRAWDLLEPYFDGGPNQQALRLGAAIQVARSELASPDPQLRQKLPELLHWLGYQRPGELGEGPELVAEEVERHRHGDRDRLGGQLTDAG